MKVTEYHIVETQTVTAEELEQLVNREVRQGWLFDGMQFAVRESSKRPAMAFLIFTRAAEVPEGDEQAEDPPPESAAGPS